MSIKIDWSDVVTKIVSTVIIAIIVAAGGIVCKAALSIDSKITQATSKLTEQSEKLDATIQVIQDEMFADRKKSKEQIDNLNKLIDRLELKISELESKEHISEDEISAFVKEYTMSLDKPAKKDLKIEEPTKNILEPINLPSAPKFSQPLPKPDFIQQQIQRKVSPGL